MTKISGYMTRAMASSDPRYARILTGLGYAKPAAIIQPKEAPVPDDDSELDALRDEYQDLSGKRVYYGWDVDDLRAKIAGLKDAK